MCRNSEISGPGSKGTTTSSRLTRHEDLSASIIFFLTGSLRWCEHHKGSTLAAFPPEEEVMTEVGVLLLTCRDPGLELARPGGLGGLALGRAEVHYNFAVLAHCIISQCG